MFKQFFKRDSEQVSKLADFESSDESGLYRLCACLLHAVQTEALEFVPIRGCRTIKVLVGGLEPVLGFLHLIYYLLEFAVCLLFFCPCPHVVVTAGGICTIRPAPNQRCVDKRSRTTHHPTHLESTLSQIRDVPRLTIDSVFVGRAYGVIAFVCLAADSFLSIKLTVELLQLNRPRHCRRPRNMII